MAFSRFFLPIQHHGQTTSLTTVTFIFFRAVAAESGLLAVVDADVEVASEDMVR